METKRQRPQAAGLKWRSRAAGPDVPYWYASPAAVKLGYPMKSANLSAFADQPALLVERAQRLQAEMLLWLAGHEKREIAFDGTFKPMIELYETDPESPFNATIKPNVRRVYGIYLAKLKAHIGARRIDLCDGRDVRRWFADWRKDEDGTDRLPRARMVLCVLKAALSFGVVCRKPGCVEFQTVLRELEFEAPESRTFAPTAEQVVAMRAAAHANKAPERALAYALQYEADLRQWDVIGQWYPIDHPRLSAVQDGQRKWFGLEWKHLGQNMILKVVPTKTEDTTGVALALDLSACPMVMEELAHWPQERRTGPMIVNPATGLPYTDQTFRDRGWRRDFADAGMPAAMWNRDLRAGGATEARRAGALKDDIRKVFGHAEEKTTDIYDRDTVEAHRRVIRARVERRGTSGKQG
jgi:hypothetical protein